MILELKKVSKHLDLKKRSYSVKEATFSLVQGQSLAILGANPTGSLDLMKLIAGAIYPSQGTIVRHGCSLAVIGDSLTFHRELTGEQNMRFLCKLYGASAKIIIPKVAAFTGLSALFKKKTKSYTPQQKRKIALTLPLFLDVDIYVINGNIGHPDAKFSSRYNELFTEKILNRTLIIHSADLDFIKKHASAAAIVHDNGDVVFKDVIAEGLDEYKKVNAS